MLSRPLYSMCTPLYHRWKWQATLILCPHCSLFTGESRPCFAETLSSAMDAKSAAQQLAFLRDGVSWAASFPAAAATQLYTPSALLLAGASSGAGGPYGQLPRLQPALLDTAMSDFALLCKELEMFRQHQQVCWPCPPIGLLLIPVVGGCEAQNQLNVLRSMQLAQ